nr:MAG TPA: hypothetical protein [Caudoviricetes sp.]
MLVFSFQRYIVALHYIPNSKESLVSPFYTAAKIQKNN